MFRVFCFLSVKDQLRINKDAKLISGFDETRVWLSLPNSAFEWFIVGAVLSAGWGLWDLEGRGCCVI